VPGKVRISRTEWSNILLHSAFEATTLFLMSNIGEEDDTLEHAEVLEHMRLLAIVGVRGVVRDEGRGLDDD
jgi:hypothetical protein